MQLVTIRTEGATQAGRIHGDEIVLLEAPDVRAALGADLSKIITLDPGDIIATGTPSGVGHARSPREALTPGAVVRTDIEGIGEMVNTCIVG